MNEIISSILSVIFTVVLAFLPYVVFVAIPIFNYQQIQHNLSGDRNSRAQAWMAYLGGFIVFIIAYAMLKTNTIAVGIDRNGFPTIFITSAVGVVVGYSFLSIAKWLSTKNVVNWFIFFTNAAVSLAAMTYVYVTDLREIFVYLCFGFALGVILYIVQKGFPWGSDGYYDE